jgi:hypothetical protein
VHVLVGVDGILEASSLIVRNEAELFHRIEVEGMNEFTVLRGIGVYISFLDTFRDKA